MWLLKMFYFVLFAFFAFRCWKLFHYGGDDFAIRNNRGYGEINQHRRQGKQTRARQQRNGLPYVCPYAVYGTHTCFVVSICLFAASILCMVAFAHFRARGSCEVILLLSCWQGDVPKREATLRFK